MRSDRNNYNAAFQYRIGGNARNMAKMLDFDGRTGQLSPHLL